MALTYSNFTTFADVASWYERTKPLRGKDNADKDIRPIGDRKRKYERIVKISDSCYALSEGHHYGDVHFPCWMRNATNIPTLKDMAFYAPIVWRKYKDGTETVTFRNGTGLGQFNARYDFLYRHTPRGLGFSIKNGKHFIRNTSDGKEYFLAKGVTVPRPVWEEAQKNLKQMKTADNAAWRRKYIEYMRVKDDGASLTFRRTDTGWEFVSGGKPIPVPPKKRVDLDAKAKLKPHIEAFRDWALAIGPLMPRHDYTYQKTLHDEAVNWGKETGTKLKNSWQLSYLFDEKLSRKIIMDDQHPMRVQLAYIAIRHAHLLDPCADEDAVKKAKARFNSWINTQLGLVKEVKE